MTQTIYENITLYILILSILFNLRYVILFILNLFSSDPKVFNFTIYEKITILFSISYIITYII